MNIQLATFVLKKLAMLGVKDIILCAGARNAPLVTVLEKSEGFQLFHFFEERSAGFFALGKAQQSQRPVVVVTTSGTAVAELLPSAVEATYTGTPLIFVTADRPRSYRGTGAPQSIDQVGLFFKYVETCLDLESIDEKFEISSWSRRGPLQINVCFKEPLIDAEVAEIDFGKDFQEHRSFSQFKPSRKFNVDDPLVIAGPMSLQEAQEIAPVLEKWGAPIYAETISNLRSFPSLQKLLIRSGEGIVKHLFIKGYCRSVIRVGGVPTLRFWRDLEEVFSAVDVVGISNVEFSGLSRSSKFIWGLQNISSISVQFLQDQRNMIFQEDQKRRQKLEELFIRYPLSEVSLLKSLGQMMENQFVYLGNSLPIREWDLVCPFGQIFQRQAGNRGANGIDGQISSFLGGSQADVPAWAIIGDLTALYDLSALSMANSLPRHSFRIVVVNNQGGMIFQEMFQKEIFLNRHQFSFENWAKMFDWGYLKIESPDVIKNLHQKQIIELRPSAQQSALFWKDYRSLSS